MHRRAFEKANGGELTIGPIVPEPFDLASRKIYVGGLNHKCSDNDLVTFISSLLLRAGACLEPSTPIVNVTMYHQKRFAFVEMRSSEEAACLLLLDGTTFQGNHLRFRRCQDYNESKAPPLRLKIPALNTSELGIVSTKVADSTNKLYVGGIPKEWNDEIVKGILEQ